MPGTRAFAQVCSPPQGTACFSAAEPITAVRRTVPGDVPKGHRYDFNGRVRGPRWSATGFVELWGTMLWSAAATEFPPR